MQAYSYAFVDVYSLGLIVTILLIYRLAVARR